MSVSIVSLPLHLFYLFANYLVKVEEQNKSIFRYSSDWRNFLNACKLHFEEWKKRSQLITLCNSFAKRFYKSATFRERVLRRIQNPLEQLELTFRTQDKLSEDLSLLSGIRKITLYGWKISTFPMTLSELTLNECTIMSLNNFPQVRKFCCESYITNPSELDAIGLKILEEASFTHVNLLNYHALFGLKYLSIEASESIADVSCFRNIQKLSLSYCNNITDVSSLGNVQELTFSRCPGIRDVSALGRVPKLRFFACENIRDVSALGKVNWLRLDGCDNIEDISALGNVHTLGLRNCARVMNVSALRNVSNLDLSGFRGNDLSGLKSVVELVICQTASVTNIRMLKTLKKLVLSHRSNVTDFRGLNNLKVLEVLDFDDDDYEGEQHHPSHFLIAQGMETIGKLTDLEMYGCIFESEQQQSVNGSPVQLHFNHFTNLRTLSLQNCVFSHFPNVFPYLQSLTIHSCQEVISLADLPCCLGYLEISACNKLKKLIVRGCESNYPIYTVKVKDCKKLIGVQVFRRISKVSIVECENFKDLDVYSQIGRLKIEYCPQFKIMRGFAPIVSVETG
jgi:hypothetical protein